MWSGKTDSSSFLSRREPEKQGFSGSLLYFKEILFFSEKVKTKLQKFIKKFK